MVGDSCRHLRCSLFFINDTATTEIYTLSLHDALPIPLKPKSYRFTAYFPEATQLAQESDVRIGGVSVGTVKEIQLAPTDQRVNGKDTTEAVIGIEPEFAPIADDARAILRQKTLLG